MVYSLGYFEDSQQAHTSQHGDTQRRHHARVGQQGLCDAANHHKAIEAIEQRHKVALKAQTVHLQQHFAGEEADKDIVRVFCKKKEWEDV